MKKEKLILKENQLDNSLKLIAKTSVIVLIGLVFSKIFSYVYRIIIARSFGPEVYGLFSLALTIALFFVSVSGFGLVDGLLRYIPVLRHKNKLNEINFLINKTKIIYLITGIIAPIILFLLADFISITIFHNANLSIFIKIMCLTIPLNLFINIFLVILRGFEKIGWYSFIFNIFQNVARVIIIASLILIGFNSNASVVAWSFVIGSILTLILSSFVSRLSVKQIFIKNSFKNNLPLYKQFFHYSWPIMLYSIMGMIFYWIDSFSIGYYKTAFEVGLYNAAVPIAMLLGFIPEIFMQLFFPLVTREYSANNPKLIEQLSKQVTKWIFMAALPIFILIFFFPGAALNLLFGSAYLPAENALRLLLVGSFISSTLVVTNNLIFVIGKSKLIMFNMLSGAFLNLVLNSILVPLPSLFSLNNSNGLLGAAFSTLISIIFINVLFLVQTKKYFSFIPIRRKMLSVALIALIPTLILFYLRSRVTLSLAMIFILALSFVIIYGLLLLISHSFDDNDWMIIRVIFKKIFRKK